MKDFAPRTPAAKAPEPATGKGVALVDNRASTVAQRKLQEAIAASPRPVAQRQAAPAPPAAPRPNRTGLPDQLKAGVESLSGHSLDDVKVHYNSAKPAQLQAHAYAQGTDIHLGPGQEKHLPHEAWHVVQQKQGRVRATMQKNSAYINDQLFLESEASSMGNKSLQLYQKTTQEIIQRNKKTAFVKTIQRARRIVSSNVIQRTLKIGDTDDTLVIDALNYYNWSSVWAKPIIKQFYKENRQFNSKPEFVKSVYEAAGKKVPAAVLKDLEKIKADNPKILYHQCSADIAAKILNSGKMLMSGNPKCVWTGNSKTHAVNGTIPKNEHILLVIKVSGLASGTVRKITEGVFGIYQEVPVSLISIASKGNTSKLIPLVSMRKEASHEERKDDNHEEKKEQVHKEYNEPDYSEHKY